MIGTLDFETDPFLYDRIPVPFTVGLYTGDGKYISFWSNNCAKQMYDYLKSYGKKIQIFAHNGGKFDFHFLLPFVEPQNIMIINGRIAKFKINNVTLTDSYLLMPFGLAQYKKTKINYDIFESDKRNESKNRTEIAAYLKDDCIDLFNLLVGFRSLVGNKLTIGAAAFYQIKKTGYKINKLGVAHDEIFRPFYFGGRCQAFKIGDFKKRLQYIDINSAYPAAMIHKHPYGVNYAVTKKLPKKLGPQFIICNGVAKGCFPFRDAKNNLTFPDDDITRTYLVTGYEYAAAMDTKTFALKNIEIIYVPEKTADFKKFVMKFYELKAQYKKEKNKIGELSSKYLLNSGYGKFATNPEKFKKWKISEIDMTVDDYFYECDLYNKSLWYQDDYDENGYYDVAVAASITGYVRAFLWRSICDCKNVYYCDTDSIICESHDLKISGKLGDWSVDGIITRALIAGKKLYALKLIGETSYKIASKGCRLNMSDIKSILHGKIVEWKNDAPTFSVKKEPIFIDRKIKLVK